MYRTAITGKYAILSYLRNHGLIAVCNKCGEEFSTHQILRNKEIMMQVDNLVHRCPIYGGFYPLACKVSDEVDSVPYISQSELEGLLKECSKYSLNAGDVSVIRDGLTKACKILVAFSLVVPDRFVLEEVQNGL